MSPVCPQEPHVLPPGQGLGLGELRERGWNGGAQSQGAQPTPLRGQDGPSRGALIPRPSLRNELLRCYPSSGPSDAAQPSCSEPSAGAATRWGRGCLALCPRRAPLPAASRAEGSRHHRRPAQKHKPPWAGGPRFRGQAALPHQGGRAP